MYLPLGYHCNQWTGLCHQNLEQFLLNVLFYVICAKGSDCKYWVHIMYMAAFLVYAGQLWEEIDMCLTAKSRSKSLPWIWIFSKQPVKNWEPTLSTPSSEKWQKEDSMSISTSIISTKRITRQNQNSLYGNIIYCNCFFFSAGIGQHSYLEDLQWQDGPLSMWSNNQGGSLDWQVT